jgi:hypothetical protein
MFHAFKYANFVTNDFENIYMEIIKACGNLEILGCYLHDIRDLEIWKGALRELKGERDIIGRFDNEIFWKILQISYNRLFKKNTKHVFGYIYIFCWFQNKIK